MRIGANIILKDGYCYQSYSWNRFRPLGELQRVIDSLEKYECDEIAIIRPIREKDSLDSFRLDIDKLSKVNCMTPISFGGGLRNKDCVKMLKGVPIERLIFSSSFLNKQTDLIDFSQQQFGHQAIQCLLPFIVRNNTIEVYFSQLKKFVNMKEIDFDYINQSANEIILYSIKNEGLSNRFEETIYDVIPIDKSKLIITGGIGKNDIKKAKKHAIASTLIDNKVLHQEYSIKDYKNA